MKRLCSLLVSLCAVARIWAADTHSPETLPLGALAPDFKLVGVDGKKYSLKDFKKADVLVVVSHEEQAGHGADQILDMALINRAIGTSS